MPGKVHKVGGHALVLEDSALVAMAAREMLLDCGFSRVTVARSSGEALGLVRGGGIDFALLGTGPDCNSMPLLAEALEAGGIPVVTACDDHTGPGPGSPWAGRPFVVRPYGWKELRAALDAEAAADQSAPPPVAD